MGIETERILPSIPETVQTHKYRVFFVAGYGFEEGSLDQTLSDVRQNVALFGATGVTCLYPSSRAIRLGRSRPMGLKEEREAFANNLNERLKEVSPEEEVVVIAHSMGLVELLTALPKVTDKAQVGKIKAIVSVGGFIPDGFRSMLQLGRMSVRAIKSRSGNFVEANVKENYFNDDKSHPLFEYVLTRYSELGHYPLTEFPYLIREYFQQRPLIPYGIPFYAWVADSDRVIDQEVLKKWMKEAEIKSVPGSHMSHLGKKELTTTLKQVLTDIRI